MLLLVGQGQSSEPEPVRHLLWTEGDGQTAYAERGKVVGCFFILEQRNGWLAVSH